MGTKKEIPENSKLRRQAEKELGINPLTEGFLEMSPEKMSGIIQELQVHQIELKMQNHELRRLNDELETARDTYSHLYDFAPVGYFTVSEKGLILAANLTLAIMLGHDRSALIGKPFHGFVQKDDQDILYKHRQRLLETGTPQSCELRLVNNKGHWFYAHLEIIVIKDKADKSRQLRVVASDITEHKLAEEALRYSERQYRTLFNSIRDALLIADTNRTIIDCNPAFMELFGYSKEDVLGKQTLYVYKSEEEFRKMGDAISNHGGDSGFLYTVHYQKKDGSVFTGESKVFYLRNDEDLVVGFIALIRDVTEHKQIEQERETLQSQLIQAQKMESVGRLAGGVAHDYNNALSVIIGFTELGMEEVDSNSSLYTNFKEILKAAKRATNITRQLLAFARKQTIAPKVIDMNETVESMLKMLRRLIGENINIIWSPGVGLWPINIDPSQIDQILANLCVNARDAIPGVGMVTMETSNVVFETVYCRDHIGFTPGKFVMLAVSDNGCGMDEEILTHIFEPFFTTKDVDKGTGLGLATVYGIAKQNNGFINVYSEPGKGTTIKIYLPRHEGEHVGIPSGNKETIPQGHGETILVVEDDRAILKLAQRILANLGYIVFIAGTPEEAMRIAEDNAGKINLLLTDLIMPEMNGSELEKRLRSIYPDLKSVFMSGYTADIIANQNILQHGVYFIQKPFSQNALAQTVRKALDN